MSLNVSKQEFLDGVSQTFNRHALKRGIEQAFVQEMVEMLRARGHNFNGIDLGTISGIRVDPTLSNEMDPNAARAVGDAAPARPPRSITLHVSMREFIDSVNATISRHPAIQQTVVLEMVQMLRERGNNLPAEGLITLSINILDYPNSPQFNEQDVRDALTLVTFMVNGVPKQFRVKQ